jgi:hypothetical protein
LDREGEMDMEVNMKGMDINSLWRGTIKTGWKYLHSIFNI